MVKIGMTERTPEERLREANCDTWSLPNWKIEFAKKVSRPLEKESAIHSILQEKRVSSRREFFKITPQELLPYFNLMDGEMWEEEQEEQEEEEKESVGKCRDMKKCFIDGQNIRHTIRKNSNGEIEPDTWIGTYNAALNGIVRQEQIYSMNKFAESHYKERRPDRTTSVNAWTACECEVNGKWISTADL